MQVNAREAHMIVIESEMLILRAMCTGAPDGRVWQDALDILGNYPFQDHLHQIIFDTLRELNTDDPRIIQGLLAARLTRKGFPDVELSGFFAPHNLRSAILLAMMQSVSGLARRRARREGVAATATR